MKRFSLFNLFFLAALLVFSFSAVKAQDDTSPPVAAGEKSGRNRRADLLEQLGLTREQLQQFRRINADKRLSMRAAQQRLKNANRELDQAIYADTPEESEVQARLREVQTAQSEVIKIRSLTELAVRRILTSGQLIKFREARQRFVAANEEIRSNRRKTEKPGD